jgi:ribbon-helix-helix CopG family protein
MANKSKIIHVAVEPSLFRKLNERAKLLEVSVSQVIRVAVKSFLEEK